MKSLRDEFISASTDAAPICCVVALLPAMLVMVVVGNPTTDQMLLLALCFAVIGCWRE